MHGRLSLMIRSQFRFLARLMPRSCGEHRHIRTDGFQRGCARILWLAAGMPRTTLRELPPMERHSMCCLERGSIHSRIAILILSFASFEVDHPATQEWKRELLETEQVAVRQRI